VKTSDFDYHLPVELIAQTPLEPRHASRLLILDRNSGRIQHSTFFDIDRWITPRDLVIINQTRVIPARIHAIKPTGGRVELLLLKKIDELTWETLVGGKRISEGMRLKVENGPSCLVLSMIGRSGRIIHFEESIETFLATGAGEMPLPPYIHTRLENAERYQTIYAREPGSTAAPTAGLHFTEALMGNLKKKGVHFSEVTLHIGLDTFAPVTEEDPQQHAIHSEWCELPPETARAINQTRQASGRVIAVGTTCVRVLESAPVKQIQGKKPEILTFSGETRLFILPGHTFQAVDAMITNFHLPRSTLIMLVSAFTGRERLLQAYQEAIREEYRFYSFGDAMFIQ
jgi:S-adenosylmethionine:tRNA ribosyltransferase-isomerase